MREGWEYKKLGEVASSELGKTLNKSKDTGNMYSYICAVNVLWDKIDLTVLKKACFEKDEIDRYSVRKGDLLVCEGGDTGRSAIWDKKEPILYQNALHRVRFTEDTGRQTVQNSAELSKNLAEISEKADRDAILLIYNILNKQYSSAELLEILNSARGQQGRLFQQRSKC